LNWQLLGALRQFVGIDQAGARFQWLRKPRKPPAQQPRIDRHALPSILAAQVAPVVVGDRLTNETVWSTGCGFALSGPNLCLCGSIRCSRKTLKSAMTLKVSFAAIVAAVAVMLAHPAHALVEKV
jgi:hypothetical protein